jgi:hypothetical protein
VTNGPITQSHFTQSALAPGKCAALIALKLGEHVGYFCQPARGGAIRNKVERFEHPTPDLSNSQQVELGSGSFTRTFVDMLHVL